MPSESRISLSVPSRLDHLDMLQAVAEEVARLVGFGEDARLDLGLAVREGVVNAMKHAHGFDATHPVDVTFDREGNNLSVSIRDEGAGFDPSTIPDPREPENLLRTSGRGLFLIHGLVDELRIVKHPRGMELVLVKRIS